MPEISEKQIKKLAAVLAISTSVTASLEADFLQCVPCIHYLIKFQGSQAGEMWALIDSGNEVNAMTPAFPAKLGFLLDQHVLVYKKLMVLL